MSHKRPILRQIVKYLFIVTEQIEFSMRDKFTENLLSRFEGREDLGKEGLYERYFQSEGLEKILVLECFEEIEFNFSIPVGVLRPEDSMIKLTERVTTSNPFLWFWWLGRNEFRGDDLLDDLNIRLEISFKAADYNGVVNLLTKRNYSLANLTQADIALQAAEFEDGTRWAGNAYWRPDPDNPGKYISTGQHF